MLDVSITQTWPGLGTSGGDPRIMSAISLYGIEWDEQMGRVQQDGGRRHWGPSLEALFQGDLDLKHRFRQFIGCVLDVQKKIKVQ
jgi:hypothetical protein